MRISEPRQSPAPGRLDFFVPHLAIESRVTQPDVLDWPDLGGLDDAARLRARVARVPHWFHSFELPGGVWTGGRYRPAEKLHRLHLPHRMDGLNVLDVGAWDGFYSFEAERRGAERVISADLWNPELSATSEGYAVAHSAMQSSATPVRASVHDLDPSIHGEHDLVLFLGVLYHLPNPFEALVALRRVTRKTLILETESDLAYTRRPALAFYTGSELGKDPTNWFGPNAKAVVAMCQAAGFGDVRVVWKMGLPMRLARAAKRARVYGESPVSGHARGRVVVHAHV